MRENMPNHGNERDPKSSQRKRAEEFRLNIPQDVLEEPEHENQAEDTVIRSHSTDSSKGEKPQFSDAEKKKMEEEWKAHKKRSHIKGRRNRILFRVVWIAMVVIIGTALSQVLLTGVNDMFAINKTGVEVTVDIPENASTKQVAEILEKSGAINDTSFFCLYSTLTKADGYYKSGTFQLTTDMDYEMLINYLQSNSNRTDIVTITFPEGLTVREMAALFEENGVGSVDEVLKAANNAEIFDKYDAIKAITNDEERYYLLEGYLFPDQYDFYKNEDMEDALGKLLYNNQNKIDKEMREQIESKGMTVDEVITLASIIQLEAADKDDMYVISSILQNRLRDGADRDIYTLDCDSTYYYPYHSAEDVPADIKDTFESTYNTYKIQGLPPGPVCNPGKEAILAAINPDDTSYYYFCHSSDGTPYYAETAAGHEANLERAGLK